MEWDEADIIAEESRRAHTSRMGMNANANQKQRETEMQMAHITESVPSHEV